MTRNHEPLGLRQLTDGAGSLQQTTANRFELCFASGATMRSSRSEYLDREHLVDHVAQLFDVEPSNGSLRGSMTVVGKYTRVGAEGQPVFTFGDPVLDLITDDDGIIVSLSE